MKPVNIIKETLVVDQFLANRVGIILLTSPVKLVVVCRMQKINIFGHIILSLFLIISIDHQAQNYRKIDSLSRANLTLPVSGERVKNLLDIAREYKVFQIDSCLRYANLAFEESKRCNNFSGQVNALIILGRAYTQKNDYYHALESYEMAIALAEDKGMTIEASNANSGIAVNYAEFGDFDKSAKYNFRALELAEKSGNKKEVGLVLGNIAADLSCQGFYSKALDYMYQALDIAKEIDDKPGIAQQYNNIAVVYFTSLKDYRKARSYFFDSFRVNSSINDRLQSGINLLNIGHCWFNLNQQDSAYSYYTKAMALFTELGNLFRIASCELAFSDFYKSKKEYSRSYTHALHALNLGDSIQSQELIMNASAMLRQVLLQTGDSVQAFRYSEKYYQAKDSLLEMQSRNDLLRLEYQYNYEKADKERKLRQQRNNYIIAGLLAGFIALMIIVVLVYSRQRIKMKNTVLEKQQMASELNFKNKELTINLMALMKSNEMLAEISQKLIHIEKKMPESESRDEIISLNKELIHTSDEKIWKEFAIRFNETNRDFYDKLLRLHPDLTQSELRLSAYLRLNMTTKEISQMTGQRILTLENARYRLRKKLGITGSDTNLVAFLSQM